MSYLGNSPILPKETVINYIVSFVGEVSQAHKGQFDLGSSITGD